MVAGAFSGVSGGAEVGRAVVVGLPPGPFPVLPLTAEDADEGQLELAVVARVDDGVEAAVEISQPEDDFEEDLRGVQLLVERALMLACAPL